MRILYLTSIYPHDYNLTSGIFVIRRIEKLLERGINLDVFALVLNHNPIIRKIFNFKNIEIKNTSKEFSYINFLVYTPSLYDYFLNKALFYKKMVESFINMLKESKDLRKYDIIHAHFIQGAGHVAYLLNKFSRIPYIVTAHGSDIHTNPFKNKSTQKLTIEILNNSSFNIFVSNYLLEVANKIGYKLSNYRIIYNGYSKKDFNIIEKSIARQFLLQYNEGNYLVGYVGRLDKIKGAHFLPYIFREVHKEVHNVQFLVVGEGQLLEFVKNLCREYNLKVIFTGKILQNKLKYIYNSLDVLILPSIREGFPCVSLEAQACGVPVVGSAIGGISESLAFNKEYNKLVSITDKKNFIKDFSQKVIEVLKTSVDRYRISQNVSHLDWDNIIEMEINLYKELFI